MGELRLKRLARLMVRLDQAARRANELGDTDTEVLYLVRREQVATRRSQLMRHVWALGKTRSERLR